MPRSFQMILGLNLGQSSHPHNLPIAPNSRSACLSPLLLGLCVAPPCLASEKPLYIIFWGWVVSDPESFNFKGTGWGCTDSSLFKSTGWSFRRLKFNSHHPYGGSQMVCKVNVLCRTKKAERNEKSGAEHRLQDTSVSSFLLLCDHSIVRGTAQTDTKREVGDQKVLAMGSAEKTDLATASGFFWS